MIFNIFFFTVLATISCAEAQALDQRNDLHQKLAALYERSQLEEVILNEIFDKNLALIRNTIKLLGMDPLKVPDHLITMTDVGIGKTHLQGGWVQNLVTIKRSGDVILRYNDKTFSCDFDLGWDSIYLNYGYTIRYLMFTRKGSFTGRFKNLRVRVLASVDLEKSFLKLEFFKFVEVDNFTLRLEGHLTDHLINILTRALTVFAKSQILREIEYQSTSILEKKLKEINELKPELINLTVESILEVFSNSTISYE
ncbi:uncharacterized protein LOC106693396 [Microplitis demolitor]|uniref:uncharacterized protein LOC106693396 n=1 Tax=Microplitis demolitor TaxID=69319 RepID=UPI0004CCB009|nr:uncharacterized protein LOC106693396 [Microplitis demolitor]